MDFKLFLQNLIESNKIFFFKSIDIICIKMYLKKYINKELVIQLKDIAFEVNKRKY